MKRNEMGQNYLMFKLGERHGENPVFEFLTFFSIRSLLKFRFEAKRKYSYTKDQIWRIWSDFLKISDTFHGEKNLKVVGNEN